MRILERARFEEIMEEDNNGDWKGDNAFQGLVIINKYLSEEGIAGAEHDIIFSVEVEDLLDAGLNKKDALNLRDLNWMIKDDYLACYV